MKASPSSLSGISVGCFRPKVKSDNASRPPTLISPYSRSKKGVLDMICCFRRRSSFLMVIRP